MGLFGFDPLKEAGGWESAMTEEEIAEMEKKAMICPLSAANKRRLPHRRKLMRPLLWNNAKQLLSLPI